MLEFYLFSIIFYANLHYKRLGQRLQRDIGIGRIVREIDWAASFFVIIIWWRTITLAYYVWRLPYEHNLYTLYIHIIANFVLLRWITNKTTIESRYDIDRFDGYVTTPFYWINLLEHTIAYGIDVQHYQLAVTPNHIYLFAISYGVIMSLLIHFYAKIGSDGRLVMDTYEVKSAVIDPVPDDICPICRENYDDNPQYYLLDCHHIAHKECLDEWWETREEQRCVYGCGTKVKDALSGTDL